MPFLEYQKVCPHCGKTQFKKFIGKGFHPLCRFFCLNCRRPFFNPKTAKQITSADFSTKKSNYTYKSKRR